MPDLNIITNVCSRLDSYNLALDSCFGIYTVPFNYMSAVWYVGEST